VHILADMSFQSYQPYATTSDDEFVYLDSGSDRRWFERDARSCESDSQEDSEATGRGTSGSFDEPIAIIGLATKFPGDAANTEAFWETLIEKRSALSKVPAERYNVDAFVCPTLESP
jgi:hypothetical protein